MLKELALDLINHNQLSLVVLLVFSLPLLPSVYDYLKTYLKESSKIYVIERELKELERDREKHEFEIIKNINSH